MRSLPNPFLKGPGITGELAASSGTSAPAPPTTAAHLSRLGRPRRSVQAVPLTAAIAQVLLIAGLADTVGRSGAGLSPAGWTVGVACAVMTNAALALGLSHYRADRLGPADWVTLARATLAVGVAALVADSFSRRVPVTPLVSLAAVALALDAVDGWVARRTRTTARMGERFDGEVDALLILILSVYVARSVGPWVLGIGAARYVFLAAGWPLPSMRAELPPRFWRKTVAAVQGVVLAVAAAHVLSAAVNRILLAVALALLAESFGRDVGWLWRHRHGTLVSAATDADTALRSAVATPDSTDAERESRTAVPGTPNWHPPASRLAAAFSLRRHTAASAGWPTPPCSPGSGSTTSDATTTS